MRNITIILLSIFVCSSAALWGQSVNITSTNTSEVTVDGDAEAFSISFENTGATITTLTADVTLPTGITYEEGSMYSSSGHAFSVVSASPLQVTISNINNGETATIDFELLAVCDAVDYQLGGGIFRNQINATYAGGTDNHQSAAYNILYGALSVLSISNKNMSVEPGDTFSRTVTIVNGGNGALSEVNVVYVHEAEINVLSTNLGTEVATDTFLINDFSAFGDGDALLEQDEQFQITFNLEASACNDVTVSSAFHASWGNYCQSSSMSANTAIDYSGPNLNLTATPELNNCFGMAENHTQKLAIKNTSAGMAKGVVVDIFKSSGTGYDEDLMSKIDISSIQYQVDGGALQALVPTTTYDTRTDGDYACLGAGAKGRFVASLPDIAAGSTINIFWDMYSCCTSSCGEVALGGWETTVDYTDFCNVQNYEKSTVGQDPGELNMTWFTESEAEIINGERQAFTYVVSSYSNTLPSSDDGYFELELNIPAGLVLANNNDLMWTSTPGFSWTPSQITNNAGTVTARFELPLPFNMEKSEITAYLTADCNLGAEGAKVVDMTLTYTPDGTCATGCEFTVACNEQINTKLNCPDLTCDNGGMRFTGFEIQRTSYGSPDNDENGFADEGGNLDFTKIKLNRVMVNDTVALTLNGIVHAGSGITAWDYGYAEVFTEEGDKFEVVGMEVSVYDHSASTTLGSTVGTTTKTPAGGDANFKVDFSPGTLASNGATAFQNFQFEENDSVAVVLYIQLTENIGGAIREITSTGDFYLSTVANPAEGNQYSCNAFDENMTIIGYFFENSWQNYVTVKNCTNEVKQYFKMSVGDCCGNFAGGNLFPYEYRNWGHLSQVEVTIPNGYEALEFTFKNQYTRGTKRISTQTINDVQPDGVAGQTFTFDMAQYYADNTVQKSDDGFTTEFTVEVAPSCDVPQNVFENIIWKGKFNEAAFLSGTETDWYTTSPDKVKFRPADLQVTALTPEMDGLGRIVNWQVRLKNNSNFSAKNVWLHTKTPTGDVQVIDVKESNASLTSSGDIWQVGTLNANASKNFDIAANYTACGREQLQVYAGYECSGYPESYDSFSCPIYYDLMYVEPKPAQLQVQIDGATVGDPCGPTMEVELTMASVQLGSVDSIEVALQIPGNNSITLLPGTSEILYPLSGTYASYTDPVLNGNEYRFWVHNIESSIANNALPGVINPDSNKLKVRMRLNLESNFVPGEYVAFEVNSERVCDDPLPQINLAYDPAFSFDTPTIAGLTDSGGDNWSVSWGDYNGDGFDDVFVTEYSPLQANKLYTNNGDQTFTAVAGQFDNDLASSLASTWGDYDNDGDLDLFVANSKGFSNYLYTNNGDGTFTKETTGDIATYDGYCHSASWADYDNDGYLDIFVSDYMPTRLNLLYHNNGDGTFTRILDNGISDESAFSIGASWADYDNDNDMDLFVPNVDKENFFYENNGDGTFVRKNIAGLTDVVINSVGSSWADFDNDGDLDLFVANAGKKANDLFVNDGTGGLTQSSVLPASHQDDTHGSAFGDFDNDGDLDLFVTNDQDAANRFYTNDGDGSFSVFDTDLTEDARNSFGTAVSDFDNDGDIDLFIANHSGDDNMLFVNSKGSCQNSLCAKLVGTVSNRSAIGAKIFVTAEVYGQTITQMREISGQTSGGAGGQNSLNALFGLGEATLVDRIEIHWPSGLVQVLLNQPVNDCLTITEEGGSLVSGTAFHDENSNCVMDEGEELLANRAINIAELGKAVYTKADGTFEVYVADGAYTLSGQSAGNWNSTCAAQPLLVTGEGVNVYTNMDFGFAPVCADPDLSLEMGTTVLRRGFGNDFVINIQNEGGSASTGAMFKFVLPTNMDAMHASPSWDQTDGDTVIWVLGQIGVGEVETIVFRDSINLGATIGDVMVIQGMVTDAGAECSTANNNLVFNMDVVGAIDPNDKQAFPKGMGTEQAVTENDTMTYKIRFQNEGSFYATRVIVIDTLNQLFDINTLYGVISSHDYQMEIIDEHIIKWTFNNIMLPTKEEDEEGSMGFIQFKIGFKKGIADGGGVFVDNTADIYFDYEEPVLTNEVLRKVYDKIPEWAVEITKAEVTVFPNPAVSTVKILSPNGLKINKLRVLTMVGQELMNISDINQAWYEITLGGFNYNLVLLEFTMENGERVVKRVILMNK